jgi:long-chain fatty acid transport protein
MFERAYRWATLSLALSLLPVTSHASAFALFENGARAMGFAGAYTAQASDPSAIFHNAAGIAFLKGTQLYGGGSLVAPTSTFTGADPFPGAGVTEKGDAGIIVPPHIYLTQQLTEEVVAGVGLDVPFGLRTGWQNADTSFSGRFVSKKAQLNGFSLNPTIAVKLADRLAIGGGVDIRFSSVELDRNIAGIDPFTQKAVDVASLTLKSNTNTGVGFNVGIIARPSDALSIGASYRHSVTVDYTGTATFSQISTGDPSVDALVARQLPIGATPVTTSIAFPAQGSVGVAYTFNDWTFEGDVNWYKWSSFVDLPISFTSRPDLDQVIPENYGNSYQFRLGGEKRLNETWSVRAGAYLDRNPVPDASVSPLLPDANRYGAAAGFSYKMGRFRVDVANLLVFFKERSTNGLSQDSYNGTYKNFAEIFAVSLGYGF